MLTRIATLIALYPIVAVGSGPAQLAALDGTAPMASLAEFFVGAADPARPQSDSAARDEGASMRGCGMCIPGDIPEDEPPCGRDDFRNANGGCNVQPPVFSDIRCGQTICGNGGTWTSGNPPLDFRDTDWFRSVLTVPTQVTWSVTAEFPSVIYILTPTPDCSNILMSPASTAGPCETNILTAALDSGEHWFFVSTSTFSGAPCGSRYRATLSCQSSCMGDLDGDHDVDLNDLALLLSEFGTSGASLSGDLDHDGSVNLADLTLFLSLFGLPCA